MSCRRSAAGEGTPGDGAESNSLRTRACTPLLMCVVVHTQCEAHDANVVAGSERSFGPAPRPFPSGWCSHARHGGAPVDDVERHRYKRSRRRGHTPTAGAAFIVKRIGVFGWGIVAPGAQTIDAFEGALDRAGTHLGPFDGFGPSNFLVGDPAFDFGDYEGWISERFPPARFRALQKKFGTPTQFALGAFIQALGQNEGVEAELARLGTEAQVIVGSGLTDITTYDDNGLALYKAQRRWDRFWSAPQRNEARRRHLEGAVDPDAPPELEGDDELERDDAEDRLWSYWAPRSSALADYLGQAREIESVALGAGSDSAKAAVIKTKQSRLRALKKEWGAPAAPWEVVSADVLWNIGSSPASQISMLGKVRGAVYSPLAACSAFGYCLKLGMDAIRRGEAKLAVIGATEPRPNALSVGTFYNARVLSHDGEVSNPLTGLKGTHVAGGSAVWIIGDLDHYVRQGWKPLGMEPVSVGLTADADHIITPSKDGPTAAIHQALEAAEIRASEVLEWDMHATGTPGDTTEVEIVRGVVPHARLTARKGFFGHGMGAGGGWELTAQYLGMARGTLSPTSIRTGTVHPDIAQRHQRFVMEEAAPTKGSYAGKLSMGVGGLNAAIISRKLSGDGA